MSEANATFFVRQELVPERPAPIKTTGFVGFLRTRLFNSPTNILLTLVGALLIWATVVPLIRFLLIDAVWQGTDRNACLAQNAGHPVGACWPYVHAKFTQFIYGFYPEAERWRVNLTFLLAVVLLVPLLIPRVPAKALNAGLFFLALPVVESFCCMAADWLHSRSAAAACCLSTILLFLSSGGTRPAVLRWSSGGTRTGWPGAAVRAWSFSP